MNNDPKNAGGSHFPLSHCAVNGAGIPVKWEVPLRVWPLVKEYFSLLFSAKVLISVVWSWATVAFCSHECPQWLRFDDRSLFVWLCKQR